MPRSARGCSARPRARCGRSTRRSRPIHLPALSKLRRQDCPSPLHEPPTSSTAVPHAPRSAQLATARRLRRACCLAAVRSCPSTERLPVSPRQTGRRATRRPQRGPQRVNILAVGLCHAAGGAGGAYGCPPRHRRAARATLSRRELLAAHRSRSRRRATPPQRAAACGRRPCAPSCAACALSLRCCPSPLRRASARQNRRASCRPASLARR